MTVKNSGTGVALNAPKTPTQIWVETNLTPEFLKEVDSYFRLKIKSTVCISVDIEEAVQSYTTDLINKNKFDHRLCEDGSGQVGYSRLSPSLYALFAYNFLQNQWLKDSKDGHFRASWVPQDLTDLSPSLQRRVRGNHAISSGIQKVITTSKMGTIRGSSFAGFSSPAKETIAFYDPTANSMLDDMIQAEEAEASENYHKYSHQAMIDSLGKMSADLTKRGNPFRGVDEGIDAVLDPQSTIAQLANDLGVTPASARRVRSRSRKTLRHGATLHTEGVQILRKLAAGAPVGGNANPVLIQHLIDGLLVNEEADGSITITGYGRIKSRLPLDPQNISEWLPACWLQED